jgi:hypothetical protein
MLKKKSVSEIGKRRLVPKPPKGTMLKKKSVSKTVSKRRVPKPPKGPRRGSGPKKGNK